MRRLLIKAGRAGGVLTAVWTACAAPATAADATPAAPAQTINRLADFLRAAQGWVSQNHVTLWAAYVLVATATGYGLWRIRNSEFAVRLRRTLAEEVLTNWRLTLLAVTSLALTLASGWTTWDGMTNFTGTPVLSFLITMGIQGVMLIAAWLIGESFAIGLAGGGRAGRMTWPDIVLAGLSVVLLAAGLYALVMALTYHGTIEAIDGILRRHKSELALPVPQENLRVMIALGISAVLTLLVVTQKEVFEPYFRGVKTVLKSLPLWVMFLACITTSVFFSFDSLFSTIFPQGERERAAQLRTTNQVAGIVSDLGATITKRQADSVDALFSSPQWIEYSRRLNDIIAIARSAPDQLAELARIELETQQSKRASLEERKASAQSQQARLDKRKESLLGDVSKLKEEVPPLAAEVDRLKSEVFKKDGEILAKKSEAKAEAGGVGGTLKAGQGPVYAERKKEMDDLAKLRAIANDQLTERNAQLKASREKLGAIEAELAQIDGEIGNLKGEMDVANQQIVAASTPGAQGSLTANSTAIATSGTSSLEDAFAQFRQRPERAAFDAIQQQCTALLTVFDRVPSIKAAAAAKSVNCDPSLVAEPVGRILALNDGFASYKSLCAKPDSLPQTSVDDLVAFAQSCVQTSGLDGKDTVAYRTQINSIGLNRDDKAHRFVVSWNAFLDGNRLAYLALLIAIALDGLVFMSGLFGANATSSPLVRLPTAARRSASDLEATMYSALRPDIYGRAKLIMNALHPIAPHDGFVSEIRLSDYDREAGAAIRSVLSMAAQFGAVEPDPRQLDVYMVRGELTEFLSKACERELRTNRAVQEAAETARAQEVQRHADNEQNRQVEIEEERKLSASEQRVERELQRKAKSLEPILTAALLSDRLDDKEALFNQASRVLAAMRPTADHEGFTSEIELLAPRMEDALLRGVLNVAAARKTVQRDRQAAGEVYLVRPEFTLCIMAIRLKAYEDWQRRSARTKRWPWLQTGRDDGQAESLAVTGKADAPRLTDRSKGEPRYDEGLAGAGGTQAAGFNGQGLAQGSGQAGGQATGQGSKGLSSANVIALGAQVGSAVTDGIAGGVAKAQKYLAPSVVRRGDNQSSIYLERVRQGLLTPQERASFDAILRNRWTNQLDSNFSHLTAFGAFQGVLGEAAADANQQLNDLERSTPDPYGDTTSPDVEIIRDAYLGLTQLFRLRAHLQDRTPIPAAYRGLLGAVEALMGDRPDAMQAFEAAVAQLDSAGPVPRFAGNDLA